MSKVSRHWCFAVSEPFNTTISWHDKVRYAVWQVNCNASGMHMMHGYIEFKVAARPPTKLLPAALFSLRPGLRDDARAHCMRGDDCVAGPWEYGTWELDQGRRRTSSQVKTNLSTMLEAVLGQAGVDETAVAGGMPVESETAEGGGASSEVPPAVSAAFVAHPALADILLTVQSLAESKREEDKWRAEEEDKWMVVRTLLEVSQRLSRQVEELQEENSKRQASVGGTTIINNNYHITNTNNGIINNTTANIVIQDVGCEDLAEFPDDRLKELLLQTRVGFLHFVRATRLNPEKPHNRNVKILSKKQNLAAVKKNGAWQQGSIAQSIEAALDKSSAQFFKPLADDDYMGHLIENEHPVVDWCQKMMAKNRSEWWPIKNTVRAELELVYKHELRAIQKIPAPFTQS